MPNPIEVATLLQQGITAVKTGRKQDAQALLMRVVELDTHNELAWLWLSGVVESFEDRRICLENVLEINPANTTAQAGIQWLNQQAPAPAQDCCPHCQALLPKQGHACPQCGQPLFIVCPHCDDYAEIDQINCPHCGHKLGYFREGPRYYTTLAEEYLAGQHHALALEALARAESTPVDNAVLLDHMGGLYARLDHPPQAIAAYRRAIACAPDNVTAYLHLGEFYRKHELIEETRALYEEAEQHFPNNTTILYELAQANTTTAGAPLRTIELLERVTRLQPDHAAGHLLLGNAYAGQRDQNAAAQQYRQVIELTESGTLLNLQARGQMLKSGPGTRNRGQGWVEVTRQMTALLISPALAALANAQLKLLRISLLAWLMLMVVGLGAWLWISAADLPCNPLAQKIFGPQGVPPSRQKALQTLGLGLWLLAFGIIVVKV